MYKEYLTAIQNHVNTHLPEIKRVAWFNDQYRNWDEIRPQELPAVYVEPDNPINWQTAGNGLQIAPDTGIHLHLVIFDLDDNPDKLFELAGSLHRIMQGFEIRKGDEQLSTAFMRTQSRIEQFNQIKIAVITYETALYDITTIPETTEVTVSLNVPKP